MIKRRHTYTPSALALRSRRSWIVLRGRLHNPIKTCAASILHLWSLHFHYCSSNLPHQGEDMRRNGLCRRRQQGTPTQSAFQGFWDRSGTKGSLPTSNPACGLSEPQETNNVCQVTDWIHTSDRVGLSSLWGHVWAVSNGGRYLSRWTDTKGVSTLTKNDVQSVFELFEQIYKFIKVGSCFRHMPKFLTL